MSVHGQTTKHVDLCYYSYCCVLRGEIINVNFIGFGLIFKDPYVANHLSYFDDKYVVAPTHNVPNNIVFVCKYVTYLVLDK